MLDTLDCMQCNMQKFPCLRQFAPRLLLPECVSLLADCGLGGGSY